MHWYEDQRPGFGVEFVGVVEAALEIVAEHPELHAVWADDPRYRRKVIRRFPYCVFYEIRESHVEIVAVAHAKRTGLLVAPQSALKFW
jgi:plasmid stabilization system protein ParE